MFWFCCPPRPDKGAAFLKTMKKTGLLSVMQIATLLHTRQPPFCPHQELNLGCRSHNATSRPLDNEDIHNHAERYCCGGPGNAGTGRAAKPKYKEPFKILNKELQAKRPSFRKRRRQWSTHQKPPPDSDRSWVQSWLQLPFCSQLTL